MSKHFPIAAEFWPLLDAACADELTDDQTVELQTHLEDNPAARRAYIAHIRLRTDIRQWWKGERARTSGLIRIEAKFDGLTSPAGVSFPDENPSAGEAIELLRTSFPPLPPLPSLSTTHYPLSTNFVGGPVFSYMVATVVLCMMLLSAWAHKISHVEEMVEGKDKPSIRLANDPRFEFVGRVTGVKDCVWVKDSLTTMVGASVPMGCKYELISGLMEINYTSGARIILEGPCDYTADSRAGGYLGRGKLTARVKSDGLAASAARAKPQAANPQPPAPGPLPLAPLFSVRTPTAIVTDLGTEFGVEVDGNGNTLSHVFEGMVQVTPHGSSQTAGAVQLGKGESIKVVKAPGSAAPVVGEKQRGVSADFVRKISRFSTEYVYDFSRCTVGNIDGQDGWYVDLNHNRCSETNYMSVVPNAAAPMSGNCTVCLGDDHENNVLVRRVNGRQWSYSIPSDADWELSALVYVGPPDIGAESMLLIHKIIDGTIDKSNYFGVGSRGTKGYNVQWRVGDQFHFTLIGEAFNEICVCQVGMTAKSLGDNRYNIALWYEMTPGDGNTRRYFKSVHNVEADISAFNTLTVYGSRRNELHRHPPSIDNLTIRVE